MSEGHGEGKEGTKKTVKKNKDTGDGEENCDENLGEGNLEGEFDKIEVDPPLGTQTADLYRQFCEDIMEKWDPDEIAMIASNYKSCDINKDGKCNFSDYLLVKSSIGKCIGESGYITDADVDGDSRRCITEKDLSLIFPVPPINISPFTNLLLSEP